MIERPKRHSKPIIQDRIQPTTIEGIIQKYDLENKDIYEFLDYLVDYLNERGV